MSFGISCNLYLKVTGKNSVFEH